MNTAIMYVQIRKSSNTFCVAILFATILLPVKFSFAQFNTNNRLNIAVGMASVDITPKFPIRMAGYWAG